jgi:two-component system response regulator
MCITLPKQPLLIVEDSREDYEATWRAFRKACLQNPMFHYTDADDALDFLHQRGAYRDPALVPGYITKPVDLEGFMQAIQRPADYWFEIVVLPKEE